MTGNRQTGALAQRDRDRRSMIVLESLIYPVFLFVALIGRLVPSDRKVAGVRSQSAFAEASDLTHSIVPWFYVSR